MKYFSLFSGIGGFELGIQQAYENTNVSSTTRYKQRGLDNEESCALSKQKRMAVQQPNCIGFSEIDKYAVSIYQKHFPNHKNYGDITLINEKELPDFDLLVGGFPCQSFSIAGKRGGFEDTRGTLFFDIARIVREKQPRLLLLENVKGLLSHDKGQTFLTILSTLDDIGYDVQWQVLNSKNHGVPQNRERVFIIGHLRGTRRPEVFPFGQGNGKRNESNAQGNDTAYCLQAGGDKHRGSYIKQLNTMQGGNRQPFIAAERGRYNKDGSTSQKLEARKDNVSNTLTSVEKDNRVVEGAQIRRLSPVECERLQGFPDVEKRSIIEVCKQVHANGAETILNIRDIDQDNAVQADVLIDCEESGVEILSHGKSLFYAKNVKKKNWSRLHIKTDDFVQMIVGINTTKEKIIRLGEGELRQNEQCLTHQQNGVKLEKLSGNEITQLVEGAKKGSTTPKELLKCITSDHSDIKNLEQKLQILSSFVTHATTGFIPEKIQNQNTFTIEVITRVGWTYGVSDTQRYKTLGNAVTVNVIRDIIYQIITK